MRVEVGQRLANLQREFGRNAPIEPAAIEQKVLEALAAQQPHREVVVGARLAALDAVGEVRMRRRPAGELGLAKEAWQRTLSDGGVRD